MDLVHLLLQDLALHHSFHQDRAQRSYSKPMDSCIHTHRKDFRSDLHGIECCIVPQGSRSKTFGWKLFLLHIHLGQRHVLYTLFVHEQSFSRGASVLNGNDPALVHHWDEKIQCLLHLSMQLLQESEVKLGFSCLDFFELFFLEFCRHSVFELTAKTV